MNDSSFPSELLDTLAQIQADPAAAGTDLLPLLYRDLRALAQARMNRLPAGQTLDPTALVHEVWLRLEAKVGQEWRGKGHFFAAAARSMRDILVEQARRKSRSKRGGDRQRADVDLDEIALTIPAEELLSLDEALDLLEQKHPRKAQVVQLRYFSGLENREVAALLDVSERTVERDWRFARVWLETRIRENESPSGEDGHEDG